MPIMHVQSESHWRSASKGISYRLCATLFTITVSFLMTGSIKTAAIIGTVEVLTKVFLYWVHERIWARIGWGRLHEVISVDGANTKPTPPIDEYLATRGHATGGNALPSALPEMNIRSLALGLRNGTAEPSRPF
jgi:uncharacterized membrane protein